MRIAVTGTALLCSAGLGAEPAFDAMLEGVPGPAGPIPGFDPGPYLGKRGIRHHDRTALVLASAATAAIDSSKLLEGHYAPDEIGIVVGATHGSIQSITDFDQEALREGPRFVNPQAFSNTVINAPAGRLAIRFGVTGLNTTLSSGSASALDAVAYAMALLQGGQIRAVLCASALGYSSEVELGYRRAGILGGAAHAEAPFSAKRRGAALGEGAAVLILERASAAAGRGAPPLAHIDGAVSAFGPASEVGASQAALVAAMRGALAQAGLSVGELSFVASAASGSVAGDAREAGALRELLGDDRRRVAVTAPKSATRECLEASGAIGLVAAVGATRPAASRLLPGSPTWMTARRGSTS